MRGLITKGIGGLYYVMSGDDIYECSTRGKFRQKDYLSPIVGDYVEIVSVDEKLSVIDKIYPRKSMLIRPNVANVEQLIVTFAAASPKPDLLLVDKLTVAAAMQNIDVIICVTKSDLADTSGYVEIYEKAGFPVVVSDFSGKKGKDMLLSMTEGKISAFAGCSGVGKSTLLNSIGEGFMLETGQISSKIERGKHTTRHVELLKLENGGYVLDTPGFSSFEIPDTDNLAAYFSEFDREESCRFSDCTHINEPDCAVKGAVDMGVIARSRYENYVRLLKEKENKR